MSQFHTTAAMEEGLIFQNTSWFNKKTKNKPQQWKNQLPAPQPKPIEK